MRLLQYKEYQSVVSRSGPRKAQADDLTALASTEGEAERQFQEVEDQLVTFARERQELILMGFRTVEEEQRLKQLEPDLATAHEKFRATIEALPQLVAVQQVVGDPVQRANLQKVLKAAGKGTVVLYTLVTDQAYVVLLITPDVLIAREYPIAANKLSALIQTFRGKLQNPYSQLPFQAKTDEDLYDILIGPIESDLQQAQAQTLLWVLDTPLRGIPINALYSRKTSQYLIESYRNVMITPSRFSALQTGRFSKNPPRPGRGRILGVSKAHGSAGALPDVIEKMDVIIQRQDLHDPGGFIAGEWFWDEIFTQDLFREKANCACRFVHLITHHELTPKNGGPAAFLLGDGTWLSWEEMAGWPAFLKDVELVFFPACNTAVGGRLRDEEIGGLSEILQRQGARSVIATHWAVWYDSTTILTQTFYKEWLTRNGSSKIKALRTAQLQLLHGKLDGPDPLKYQHPYYWAPYVLVGDWQ